MSLLELVEVAKNYGREGKLFSFQTKRIRAVDGVTLSIEQGQALGLVGESGCGKSTLARLVLRLDNITSGRIIFKGVDITDFDYNSMLPIRKNMQIVFQNSYASFNPLFTVERIVGEPLANYGDYVDKNTKEIVTKSLDLVGLGREMLGRFPHELSGGQRQRVGIARALALKPDFLVCDEPVSSLDFTSREQVLKLLLELRSHLNLTYLFISHDISSVQQICDRVAVMYMGKIVEVLPTIKMEQEAIHPYTRVLLESIPVSSPVLRYKRNLLMKGEPPDPYLAVQGCRFYSRCIQAVKRCQMQEPALENVNEGHQVACLLIKKGEK